MIWVREIWRFDPVGGVCTPTISVYRCNGNPLAPYTCINLIHWPSATPALTFPRNLYAAYSTVAVIHFPLSKSIQCIGVARSNLHGFCLYLAAQIYMVFAFTRLLKFTWYLPLPVCWHFYSFFVRCLFFFVCLLPMHQ